MRTMTVRLPRVRHAKLVLRGLACLAMLAIAAAPAQAQQQRRQREMDPEQRMQMLQEKLSLTDEQVAALQPIFAEHDAQRRALFESVRDERQAMRDEMDAMRTELDEELASVLTPDQMTAFRELREENRQRFKQGRGKKRGPPSDG